MYFCPVAKSKSQSRIFSLSQSLSITKSLYHKVAYSPPHTVNLQINIMTLKEIKSNKQLAPLINVALFAILLLVFHYLFRYWANHLHYWPIITTVGEINQFLMKLLYDNSLWALQHLTTFDFTTDPETRTFLFGSGSVYVSVGCSGFKQFLQWIVLMLFFPGPWKHKLWFIPAGLIVTHLVNIFRIDVLVIILDYFPQYWKFTHDWILRPFFYVIMFGMWVIWVEKFIENKVKK